VLQLQHLLTTIMADRSAITRTARVAATGLVLAGLELLMGLAIALCGTSLALYGRVLRANGPLAWDSRDAMDRRPY
jgi:hypothetical protein